mgnify:CR=1 FL=1
MLDLIIAVLALYGGVSSALKGNIVLAVINFFFTYYLFVDKYIELKEKELEKMLLRDIRK